MKGIVVFLLVFWGLLPTGDAKTIVVSKEGQLQSIQQALQLVQARDSLIVKEGFYQEGTLIIDQPLFFIGENRPILDGANENEIIRIIADSVYVAGFQIQNVGTSYLEDRAGISIEERRACVVEDNHLLNTFFGIYLKKSSHCTIQNNKVIGEAKAEASSGNAIQLWYCDSILVKGNTLKQHRDGIYLEFVDNSIFEDNLSENNLRYGMHFMFSNHDKYLHNTFKGNGAGVAVMFSSFISMKYNRFQDNWGSASYGLLLKEIYDGQITNNQFIRNTIGIYFEGANRMHVEHNEFRANGWALKVMGSSMENTITANNFLSNSFDVTVLGKRNHNTYQGNFWSEYNGYDLDQDGHGDVPYRPVKLYAYLIAEVPESIVLLRSLFIDLLNFAEKVTPIFTPENLMDEAPLMNPLAL